MSRDLPPSVEESLDKIAEALDKIEESLTKIENAVALWAKPSLVMNYNTFGEKKGVTEDHG